jgi:Ca-activated chloride channel homolog
VHVVLESPRWLWLLVLCVPAVWIVAWSWPVRWGAARLTAAILRTLVLTGFIVAASGPIHFTDSRAVSVVVLCDVSASVSDGELEQERRVVQRLASLVRPQDQLRLVGFAAAPVEILPSVAGFPAASAAAMGSAVSRPAGEAGLGTDIARALGLAVGLADPARARRVLLISDGRPTAGDALAQAQRLAALGVRVDYIALLPTGTEADVAIDSIAASGDIRPHATFPLEIRIVADRPAHVLLAVKRDGRSIDDDPGDQKDGTPKDPGRRARAIPAGESTVIWNTRIDTPGTSIFSVDVSLTDGIDAHPQNNHGLLAVAVQSPPRVLILAPSAFDAAPLIQALGVESIDVRLLGHGRGRESLDAAFDAAGLALIDLIAFVDLPRAEVSDAVLAKLDAYVHDGGGLLVTGGPHAFGPGGWDGSRLEKLLPVRLDLPALQDVPALALALVIDRSGSMGGAKMDLTKQAARATAEMLPPDDQIAVIAFDSQATTVVPLQRAANRLRIATDIGRIQATGGTNILAGLREALEQLGAARAKKKHAILLSDGQSATDGIAEVVDAAAGSRITISTVGVGDGVDDGLLQLIASRGGGRYYHTRDPASIPRIFSRETSEIATSGIVEQPTPVVPRAHAAMLDGIPLGQAPRLGGYVRTHARAQADLLLATPGGDPLLARWPVGLGQVVAWTSDLGARWADAWARWPPFAKLWGQIARTTMRARAARHFPLVARLDGGFADVSVEAVGPDDRFASGLEALLEITEVRPDGTDTAGPTTAAEPSLSAQTPAKVSTQRMVRQIALSESAPGHYEARFAIAPAGGQGGGPAKTRALLLRATLRRDGRAVAEAGGQLSIPFAPELRPAVAGAASGSALGGPDLLAAIAARTGGGRLASPEDLLRDATPGRTPESLRSPLLVLVAVLFLIDVAVRKLTENRAPKRGVDQKLG